MILMTTATAVDTLTSKHSKDGNHPLEESVHYDLTSHSSTSPLILSIKLFPPSAL